MSTIALERKNQVKVHGIQGIFREIAKTYRENRAEIICGLLSQSGNSAEAAKLYLMMKR